MFMPVATDPSSQCDSRRHWVWRIFPPLAQLQPDGSRRHRKGALKSPLADLMQKNGSVVTTGSATSYRFRTRENRFLTLAFLISFRSATSSGATPSGTIFVAAPTATSIPSTGRCLRVCRKRVGKPTGTGQLRSSPIPARRSYDGGGRVVPATPPPGDPKQGTGDSILSRPRNHPSMGLSKGPRPVLDQARKGTPAGRRAV